MSASINLSIIQALGSITIYEAREVLMRGVTSFLHKSAENEDRIDVSDEVATTKLFARKQRTSQNKRHQTSCSFKLFLKQKATTTSFLHPNTQNTTHTTYQTCLATDLELVTTPLRPVTTLSTVMLAV